MLHHETFRELRSSDALMFYQPGNSKLEGYLTVWGCLGLLVALVTLKIYNVLFCIVFFFFCIGFVLQIGGGGGRVGGC